MKINIFDTEAEVLDNLAAYFATAAKQSINENGKFSVALSGGSSPKKLYELLASVYSDKVDWKKVYFFFGDERNVPQDNPESNYFMAKKALFDPLTINKEQIFAVDTSLEPEMAAQKYADVIKVFFKEKEVYFDLVLLGLGDNSHTASLFPYTPVLTEKQPTVKEVFLTDHKVFRITLTAPLINQAHRIAFLVYGKEKAEAVRHVIEDSEDINNFPAQLIKPINGEVQWFLDQQAASRLKTVLS